MNDPEAVADGEGEPRGFPVAHFADGDVVVPIFDQLYVGRECTGIGEHRRLLIPDWQGRVDFSDGSVHRGP